MKMRLDKMLSNSGVGSRKDIKSYAKSGIICVNGNVCSDPGMYIDTDTDDITVNGNKITYKQFIYLMLNKPAGYISATFDKKYKTVLDLVPEEYLHYNLFPVGRLDIDTEGLLILTNDGDIAHRVLSPKSHVPKTYFANIEGKVTDTDVLSFKNGVVLDDGYITMSANLEIIQSGEKSKIYVTIFEGKFHQIKRMFESIGKKVTYLKRISFGSLNLPDTLNLGEITELTSDDICLFMKR